MTTRRIRRTAVFALVAAAVALGALAMGTALAADYEPLARIQTAAEAHVLEALGGARPALAVAAAALDPRLHLQPCAGELETFVPGNRSITGNATIGVRCPGPRPWKIYVPVRVQRAVTVLIARHALVRDSIVGAGDVETVTRDEHAVPYGHFSDLAAVKGRRLTRNLPAGAVLTPANLAHQKVVRRGQRVAMTAAGAAYLIQMSGEALADGAVGERIRVRNLSSGRTVEAVVESADAVRIALP